MGRTGVRRPARPLAWRHQISAAAAVLLLCLSLAPCPVQAYGAENTITVEYDNLRELLKKGNLSLSQSIEDYEDNLEAYQEMWDTIKWEQGNMEDKAEDSSAEAKDAALYASNASMLKSSASRIYSQLKELKTEKSLKSLEKSADSYTLAAQTVMNSYLQVSQTIKAKEKSVEALAAKLSETRGKQGIGAATQADVEEASGVLAQESNSLGTLREEASQLRSKLLTMLGLAGEENVIIGGMPEPDLEAIDAIDYETDRVKAVNNSSTVQETRHTTARGTGDMNRKSGKVDEAEGTAEANIKAAYQDLLVRRTEYQASQEAYGSALMSYQSLMRKKQAGMLSSTAYLDGEAAYQESLAARETASMNLIQAYEGYCWEVKGVT